MRTLRDLKAGGRRVFVRVDFNVPIEGGRITDDTRIRASLPTIRHLLDQGATVILASHLGRPKGKPKPEFSLKPVAEHLAGLLGRPVAFAPDCIGPAAADVIQANRGGVIVLENLRFHPEEEANDPAFAQTLAGLADVYVNDAFGSAHRAHASTEGIVHHVAASAAGLLMAAEVEYLGRALSSPDRPFVAILGGAKVSDKLEVIENLLGKVDALLIGGAMAYTFLKAQGRPIGTSRVEDQLTATAAELMARASERGLALELPVDHVVARALEAGVPTDTLVVTDPTIGDRMGLDIGPATVARYARVIQGARTVVWNGPMGVFEIEAFAAGTIGVARAVAAVQGTTIIGGGASLEFLGGRMLPVVEALR